MARKYDLIFALIPQTAEDKIDALISKIEKKISSLGGEISNISKKGVMRIASRMRKFKNIRDGFYVSMNFSGSPAIPKEIENILKVNDAVMKHIITLSNETPSEIKSQEKTEEKVEINPEMLIGKPQ